MLGIIIFMVKYQKILLKVAYLNLLDVGNNNLNDTSPNWLGNLDRLHVLTLRSSRFYGQVDSFHVTVCLTR
ncbi:hypothetical protein Gotur_035749 [Gossypium turneri]